MPKQQWIDYITQDCANHFDFVFFLIGGELFLMNVDW